MEFQEVPEGWYVIEQAHIDGIVFGQDWTGGVYKSQPSIKPVKVCNLLIEYITE